MLVVYRVPIALFLFVLGAFLGQLWWGGASEPLRYGVSALGRAGHCRARSSLIYSGLAQQRAGTGVRPAATTPHAVRVFPLTRFDLATPNA